jgi:hypothetical protein
LIGGRVQGLGLVHRSPRFGWRIDARFDAPATILHHGANAERAVVGRAVERDQCARVKPGLVLGVRGFLEEPNDLCSRERCPRDRPKRATNLELGDVAVGQDESVGAIAHHRGEKSVQLCHH